MADPWIDRLEEQFSSLMKVMKETNSKVDSLISKGDNSESGENSNARNKGKNHCESSNSATPKLAKLNYPRFGGDEDPTSWICNMEQFFEYQQTEEGEKLPLTAYHLEGVGQVWYQIFKESEKEISWESMRAGLYTRYGSTRFEDHFGDLTKLWQGGSVRDYQAEFERLLSRVGKLSTQHQLGCFVSGLKETIRIEDQAAKPTSLTEAIGLAQLFEAKVWSGKKPPNAEFRQQTYGDSLPPLSPPNLTKSKNPPIRKLTLEEMQDRRSSGLCFNWDEKFIPGHRCRKLFLIEGIYAEEEGEKDIDTELEEDAPDEPRISLHAITGSPTPWTMRFPGRFGNYQIMTLMDTRSTHNFLNSRLAKRHGLKPTQGARLLVTVANGEKLECCGICMGVRVMLQGEPFTVDFFLLQLEGCDAVLETQWLSKLGPVWWDFAKLLMKFF